VARDDISAPSVNSICDRSLPNASVVDSKLGHR